jgi:hypothetical protein
LRRANREREEGKEQDQGDSEKIREKERAEEEKPADMVAVRENINDLVKNSAEFIATKVIEVARTGQLASAKYLFEAVGLYPATEETEATPVKDTLAHSLLTRMGLPLDPVVTDEDMVKPMSTGSAKGAALGPIRVLEKNLVAVDDSAEVSGEEMVSAESEE